MIRIFALTLGVVFAVPAMAQEQQAGTAVDTDAAFQALIDACDDVDALMLRARIRLQIPRATEEAATTAQQMLDEAFATCGNGDLEAAKTQLAVALELAEAGATERLAAEAPAEPAASEAAPAPAAVAAEEKKPWWKIW